jgi:hypothetical protein
MSDKTMVRRLAFGVALLAAGSGGVALGQDQKAQLKTACAADARTYCAGVRPGGGRIQACLRQSADQLTANCKAALAGAKSG